MSTPPGMAPRPLELLDESTFQSVMCVVAHPDDIEYGLSAAVDKWVKAGKTVTYLLASRGEAGIDTMHPDEAGPAREAEEIAAAEAVGVDIVDFLDFRDGVIEYGVPLRRELCKVMRMRRPDCVVSQGHDVRFMNRLSQSDHRAVGLATLDAVRDCGNRLDLHRPRGRGRPAVGRHQDRPRRRLPRRDPLHRRRGAPRAGGRLARGPPRLQRRPARRLPQAARAGDDDPRDARAGDRTPVLADLRTARGVVPGGFT